MNGFKLGRSIRVPGPWASLDGRVKRDVIGVAHPSQRFGQLGWTIAGQKQDDQLGDFASSATLSRRVELGAVMRGFMELN